jgi:membrane protease YdiL (CAAX protease family)
MSHLPPPPSPDQPPMPPPRPGGRDPDPPWPKLPSGTRHDAGAPEEAFRVPFTVLDSGLMIVWTLLAQILVAVLATVVGVLDLGTDLADQPVHVLSVTIVGQSLTLVGLMAYLQARGALTWRLLGPVRPRIRHVWMGAGLGLTGLLMVLVLGAMINEWLGPFDAPEQFALQVSDASILVLMLSIVTAVIMAPLVEEVVFRGMLFQTIRSRLGLSAAIVIQALVFAYIHIEVVGSPPAIVGLVALGLWFAAIFHRVGSLVVAISAHAFYNLAVVAIQVIFVASE